MNPYDLTAAAAHAHVHELRDAASASRLAAHAECARTAGSPTIGRRVKAALHLDRSPACD